MTIPASKVKAICTASEAALVRASRKGEIEQLGLARLKQLALRARKLANKWRDLQRGQSRVRSRSKSYGNRDTNTLAKEQIFRDALNSFEARIAQLDVSGAPAATGSGKTTINKNVRAAEHRARRAAVRKGLTAVEDLLNAEVKKEEKPVKPAPTHGAIAATAAPPEPSKLPTGVPRTTRPAATIPKPRPKGISLVQLAKQRQATTAAKHSRVVRSGKTTRVLAHVKSRGKRVQARRDAKN
jgi:hypothetical protein